MYYFIFSFNIIKFILFKKKNFKQYLSKLNINLIKNLMTLFLN